MKRLRPSLTYANVVATVALFLALGGGVAYGASQLAKNSVGAKQLKRSSVTSAKVKDASLTAKDFKAGQLPAGERGPQGPKGNPGATAVVVRYGEEGKPKEGEFGLSYASCLTGETVVGGGYEFLGEEEPENFEYAVVADRPSLETGVADELQWPPPADGTAASGWLVAMENETSATFFFRTYVLCARP
jgi:hypothetical protein